MRKCLLALSFMFGCLGLSRADDPPEWVDVPEVTVSLDGGKLTATAFANAAGIESQEYTVTVLVNSSEGGYPLGWIVNEQVESYAMHFPIPYYGNLQSGYFAGTFPADHAASVSAAKNGFVDVKAVLTVRTGPATWKIAATTGWVRYNP